jgi:hypothetical protein
MMRTLGNDVNQASRASRSEDDALTCMHHILAGANAKRENIGSISWCHLRDLVIPAKAGRQTLGCVLSSDWIPALRQAQGKLFAGMTGTFA